MFNIIKLNEKDNIGIATMDIPENVKTSLNLISKDKIPYGHKISLKKITPLQLLIQTNLRKIHMTNFGVLLCQRVKILNVL